MDVFCTSCGWVGNDDEIERGVGTVKAGALIVEDVCPGCGDVGTVEAPYSSLEETPEGLKPKL